MNNCPYCNKQFISWKSVRSHTSACPESNGLFYISLYYGPIHITDFNKCSNYKELKATWPLLESKVTDLRKKFGNLFTVKSIIKYSDHELIQYIQDFYKENNRIPQARDFRTKTNYPDSSTFESRFGSWNKAIEAAGFTADYNDGYGFRGKALDGNLYRSKAEIYFCDNYLYGKYKYVVEPKYPEPYNRYYDWYLPELDLYIELDGGLRPETIKEKLAINSKLSRNLLVIPIKDIYNKKELNDFSKLELVI